MKTFCSQIIVILLLLFAGFFFFKYSANEESRLKVKNEELTAQNEQLTAENQTLTAQNQQLTESNELLQLANRYLKTDYRTARIEVLEQKTDPESPEKVLETKIRFTEFDPSTGSIAAKPAEFTVGGDMIYVDALIVKFDDVLVESADILKNRSLVSFQRIFGENQAPSSGYRIDAEGQIPSIYRSSPENEEAGELERLIWSNFWKISNDPKMQKELGIRAIHGEAPSQRLEPGRLYYLDLRASGGLSFKVE